MATKITHNGVTDSIAGWERRVGLPKHALVQRLAWGWDFERAISQPIRSRRSSEEVRCATEKLCSTCGEIKPLAEFHRSSRYSDGRKTTCRICRNVQNRSYPIGEERYIRQRTRYKQLRKIIEIAKAQPCVDCGIQYPGPVMHFHHRDPKTKVAEVAKMVSRTEKTLLAEIAKCDIMCANCHIIRHLKEESRCQQ